MANVIKLKRGTSTPTTSNIANGEVAVDTSAQKLYINDDSTIKVIGGISNLVEDTSPELGGNLDMQSHNISGSGTVIAASTAVATAGFRKIHAGTSTPANSLGSVGDLFLKY